VASGSDIVASHGAALTGLANVTTSLFKQLPPPVQTYIGNLVAQVSSTIADSTEYVQSVTSLSPTALYSTAGAVLILGAIPALRSRQSKKSLPASNPGKMSRYGWSRGETISPFASNLGDGPPDVTDADFSYITSEDLERSGMTDGRYAAQAHHPSSTHGSVPNPSHRVRSTSRAADEMLEDDILFIRNKRGIIYPEKFPAFSIGDGKLLVTDLRDRVRLALKLTDAEARRARLLYKGRHVKDVGLPICEYGVKNNSEILVEVPDVESSDDSAEEIVVLEREGDDRRKKKSKKRRGRRRDGDRDDGNRSPPDSGSNVGSNSGLEVPRLKGDPRARSGSRGQSPVSGVSAGGSAVGGPIEKLNAIGSYFTTKLLPQCVQFTARPPADPKKREEEHRKLSEMVMQQVLLKLDEVETAGDEEARAKRKELVRQVQDVLKGLDGKLKV
jgi:hypothetical protein